MKSPHEFRDGNGARIELSHRTLVELDKLVKDGIETWHQDDIEIFQQKNLHETLTRLISATRRFGCMQGVAFYYDRHAGKQNTDCLFYRRASLGVVDKSIGAFEDTNGAVGFDRQHCNDQALSLSRYVKEVFEPNDVSRAGTFEKYYYPDHPDKNIREIGKSAEYSIWTVYDPTSGISEESTRERLPTYKLMSVPTEYYTTTRDTSLWEILRSAGLPEERWPSVWVLNSDEIGDPASVAKGVTLKIPKEITRWEQVPKEVARSGAGEFAEKFLGNIAYQEMLERFIEIEPYQAHRGVVFLPVAEGDSAPGRLGSFFDRQ